MAIELDAELVNETDLAFLIVVDGNDDNQVWIPRSLGSYTERPPRPLPDVLVTVPEWFAKREGLI